MTDPDVTIKGILGVNDTAPSNENTGYYLDHVAIEVDMSEIEGLDRSLESLSINVEGHSLGFQSASRLPGSRRWRRGHVLRSAAKPVARGQHTVRVARRIDAPPPQRRKR